MKSKNTIVKSILDREIPVLVPYELWEDFHDFTTEEQRAVIRANCLRRYVEGLVKLFFEKKILSMGVITPPKWNKLTLHNKLEYLIKHFDKEIGAKLKEVKNIGNQGSHFGQDVPETDIKNGVEIVTSVFEMLIIRYFKSHKIGSEPPVMTLLSSLPPIKRVYILEKLSETDRSNLNIVDKLSMAYLKSGMPEKALDYLDKQLMNGIIDQDLHENFKWKINELSKYLHKFDISKHILDTKRIFELLTTEGGIDLKDYEEFISILLALLSGYSKLNMEEKPA